MPKMKSNRAARKRFKVTGRGLAVRAMSGKRHGMIGKSRKRKRRLLGTTVVAAVDQPACSGCSANDPALEPMMAPAPSEPFAPDGDPNARSKNRRSGTPDGAASSRPRRGTSAAAASCTRPQSRPFSAGPVRLRTPARASATSSQWITASCRRPRNGLSHSTPFPGPSVRTSR
jgi:large subunit ribosomal protein L35